MDEIKSAALLESVNFWKILTEDGSNLSSSPRVAFYRWNSSDFQRRSVGGRTHTGTEDESMAFSLAREKRGVGGLLVTESGRRPSAVAS